MSDFLNLLGVNCAYNYIPGEDGKCRSTTCMLNADKSVSDDIQLKGCSIYKNLAEAVEAIKRKVAINEQQ